MGISVVLVGTGLSVTFRRSSDWASRNRIRWVLMGTLVGGLLPLLLIILPRALGFGAPMEEHLALLFLLFLPLCLVISVLRHNLLDISIVMRQGVMYGPATVIVYLLFGGIFVVLGFISFNTLPDVNLPFTFRALLILALPLLLFHLFYEPLRKRVQGIVNRLFFRTKYSYGRTVRTFNEKLDRSLTGAAIINHLRSQVMQTVMPTWVHVVERGRKWHGIWENIESAGAVEKPLLNLPFHELEGLEMWVGPKRSGMAYHTYDRALLETLVGLTSTALQREVLQRQLLEEAAEKERLEALTQLKDDFLSLVSHDLRSPLATISLSASMMARRCEETGDSKGAVDATRIERNILRLTQMVERLLHAARVDAGRVEPKLESCRLAEVAQAVFDRHQLTAEAEQVVLESSVPEDSVVRADPLLLQEVISNLVDNALKVSESGMVISVGAERADQGWYITVTDQGPGIPEERIPTLFERGEVSGTMAKTAGFGLGLFLVHELVALQGGRVELRYTSPEGTTFTIHLPE
jgi:signal transduction histidine kinase